MKTHGKENFVLAVGNFDGLHLGHRALMEELFKQKQKWGAKSGVITFSPHPLTYLTGKTPPMLMTDEDKQDFLHRYMAIDHVNVLPFNKELAELPPREFLKSLMQAYENVRHLVVGFNFTFGRFGEGDTAFLRDFCLSRGIGFSIIPAICGSCGVVSSSSIREKIAQGDIEGANEMLGYWYSLKGVVQKGRQLGRLLGFRTANILPDIRRQLPPKGVYATRIARQGQYFDGIANIGCRPTVEEGKESLLLEAHLFLEDEPDLYGEELEVFFGRFIRPEERFEDLKELKQNIGENILTAKEFLAAIPPQSHLPKSIK